VDLMPGLAVAFCGEKVALRCGSAGLLPYSLAVPGF
jgi:hypothetical protein